MIKGYHYQYFGIPERKQVKQYERFAVVGETAEYHAK